VALIENLEQQENGKAISWLDLALYESMNYLDTVRSGLELTKLRRPIALQLSSLVGSIAATPSRPF
jgi:hypothetical protein